MLCVWNTKGDESVNVTFASDTFLKDSQSLGEARDIACEQQCFNICSFNCCQALTIYPHFLQGKQCHGVSKSLYTEWGNEFTEEKTALI